MATLDIVVIAVILLTGLVAFGLGFVRMVLGLAGWLGALVIAFYGYHLVLPFTQHWIGNQLLATVAAFGGLFIVALIVLSLFSHAISRLVRNSALSVLDRSLGLAFGLALGVVVVCVGWSIAVPVLKLPPDRGQQPEWARESRAVPLLDAAKDFLAPYMPKSFRHEEGRREAEAPADAAAARAREVRTQIDVAPKSAAPGERSGYDARQRDEMDRLLRSQR